MEVGGAPVEVVKKRFAVLRNADDRVSRSVVDEGRSAAGVQSVDHGGPVAQKAQGLIGQRLAHRLGAVPVFARAVEIATADQDAGVEPLINSAGNRDNE